MAGHGPSSSAQEQREPRPGLEEVRDVRDACTALGEVLGGSEWQRPDLRPAGMPRASDSAGARTQPQSRSYTHQLLTEEHDKTVREA